MKGNMTRRRFVATTVAATALVSGTRSARSAVGRPAVCIFSKHLQFLDYRELAKTCKELGLDGVDLAVRDKGHVSPDRVAEDLPRAVDAIRGEGLDVPMITTALFSGEDPDARPILSTASKLGIPYFRIGGQTYSETGNPLEQLPKFTEELRGLAKLAEEFHITAGYHNHSGYDDVGAPLWDLHALLKAVGSDRLGSNFDVGHAKVEGGYGAWQINARLLAPYVKMMAVKDFVWEKDKPKWVPLGEGIVPVTEFLKIFREQTDFAGPISLHFEYRVEPRNAMLDDMGKTVATLRRLLEEAGYG
jgi:sugar phosphate isomerase/epimerase